MSSHSSPLAPVTLLAGFLGAGKTTLLNHILQGNHGLRIGVLVNDFGAVNIDARLVAGMDGEAVDLTNGCVCCSMRGGLVTSLAAMLARPNPPDYLIVEASGIADPLAIVATFQTSAMRALGRLDAVITLVDAENAWDPRLDQQLIQDQIRAADIVVTNKIDLVSEEAREELRAWIRSLVPRTRIMETVQARLPLDLLIDVDANRDPNHMTGGEHDHNHTSEYSTWSYRTERRLAYRKVRAALEGLPPTIFRAKGILSLADAPNLRFVMQLVGKRIAIDVDGPWRDRESGTELVFIGAPGSLTMEDLVQRFDECATESIVLRPRPTDGPASRPVLHSRRGAS